MPRKGTFIETRSSFMVATGRGLGMGATVNGHEELFWEVQILKVTESSS